MFTLESSLPPPSSCLQPPAAVSAQLLAKLIAAFTNCVWLDATCCPCFCFFVLCGRSWAGPQWASHTSVPGDWRAVWVLWLFLFCVGDCFLWDALLPRQSEEKKQRNAARHLLGTLVTVFRTELVTKAVNWNLADWLLLRFVPPWLSSRLLFLFSAV